MPVPPDKVRENWTPIRLGTVGGSVFNAFAYQRHALLVSENHRRSSKGDNGGPFFAQSVIRQVEPSAAPIVCRYSAGGALASSIRYVPNIDGPGSPMISPSYPSWTGESSALDPLGTTGWKRARPGNPVANAGQFIAELRDLPTLPLRLLSRLHFFRGLGKEYLNVQFGWKPFVSDVKEMFELYQNLDKKLAQLRRDNGRPIRRRRTVKNSTETTSTSTGQQNHLGNVWPVSPAAISPFSSMTVQTVTKEQVWFVGCFRYYVADIGSSQWTRRATMALYGLNPTPSLLWNILPWSWLIDWFSNTGDVLSNASSNAVDNLVAHYAYVMRTVSVQTTYTSFYKVDSGTSAGYKVEGGSGSCTVTKLTTTKARKRATPYGFGVSFDGLSAYQTSILAALGMSRSRF
jgi:hypothetical protein